MSRHSVKDDLDEFVEAIAPEDETRETERYRPRIRKRRVLWEVQIITRHTIRSVNDDDPRVVETVMERPFWRWRRDPCVTYVLSERWANWKGRRMVAAAHRRDVREGQPWAVQQ